MTPGAVHPRCARLPRTSQSLTLAAAPRLLGAASVAERESTHMCTSSSAHLPCFEGFSRVKTACMA